MPIQLVLADDHALILDGLESLFRAHKDFKVLARCADGDTALSALRLHKPDILILDLNMPGRDGLSVLREMKKNALTTRVVVLTATLKEEELAEAVRLGVRGFFLKELAPELLIQCLFKVHAGELWLEKQAVTGALERLLQREAGRQEAARLLTARETEIVKQVALGLRNSEIAKRLFISEGTVQVHLHSIYQKLNVENRAQLVRWAQEKSLQ